MNTTTYLDRFLDPLADAFTPEFARKIAGIQVDSELQAYVDQLATKANDGTITEMESAEYKAIVDAADLISVLQIKARRFLAKRSA